MSLGRTRGVALQGIEGALVDVEADLVQGLPQVMFSGLPDAACRQAPDRIKAAAANSGVPIPNRRLTVNLSPASIPKVGSGWDLPIAIAVLAAAEVFPARVVDGIVHVGELGLDGSIRPVRGVLPVVLTAARLGVAQVVVPAGNAAEAALVPGVSVVPASHLRELVSRYRAIGRGERPESVLVEAAAARDDVVVPDLRDVVGQDEGRLALEIAAAGGHNLLLEGPPGTGKSMLARRLPGILPPLSREEALEVTRIHSVAGLLWEGTRLLSEPPFRAPHHGASAAAVIGGGATPRPGEVSLAHRGVLLLDELPEFPRSVLEALRQPLEDGVVSVVRAGGRALFPARFRLVGTMNLCPCGARGDPRLDCACTATRIAAYRDRVSRALLDRFDLTVTMPRPLAAELAAPPGEASAAVRDRVAFGAARLAEGRPSRVAAASELLDRAVERLPLSGRGRARVARVARTVAALADSDEVLPEHVAEALSYRAPRDAIR